MSVYPTLCELAGLPIPKHVQGVSIKRLLAEPVSPWTRAALTTYGYQNHAVRTEHFRYIRYANGDEELYDEVRDPFEWTNIAALAVHNATKAELARWFPTFNKPALSRKGRARAARKARIGADEAKHPGAATR